MTLKLETTEDAGKSQMGKNEFVTPGRALTRGQVCLLGLVKLHRDLFKGTRLWGDRRGPTQAWEV